MKNPKILIMCISVLIFVFILGFLTKSIIPKNDNSIKVINESKELLNSYSISLKDIDSIENISILYYDTANVEMLHYAIKYYNSDIDKCPDYYVTKFNDTIEFNKINFFRYVALYTVADNLLESRKYIINGLLMKNNTEELDEIRNKIEK